MVKKQKKVSIKFNTTEEFLKQRNITLHDIKKKITYLGDIFGTKYVDLFPTKISNNNIDNIFYCTKILKVIQKCNGFKKHINEYNSHNIKAHLFTAQVSGHLLNLGYEITLEPDMAQKTGPHPDIKIEKNSKVCYIECKTSDISNFFRKALREKVAEIIYEKAPTCDQIDLFFSNEIDIDYVNKIFKDKNIIKQIHMSYKHGRDGKETRLKIDKNLEINITQKPTIIGAEDTFITAELLMCLEDNNTNIRQIGYAFMKGGRSIGVWETVDYGLKLKSKREQSQKQLVDGYPNIVFIDGADVIGDPISHEKYFNEIWLTKELPNCSGVVIFYSDKDEKIKFYKNSNTTHGFIF